MSFAAGWPAYVEDADVWISTKMRSVLVTGEAGYIGSHACKALSKSGFLPITYDNLSRGHSWAVKWGPLEQGDIQSAARFR